MAAAASLGSQGLRDGRRDGAEGGDQAGGAGSPLRHVSDETVTRFAGFCNLASGTEIYLTPSVTQTLSPLWSHGTHTLPVFLVNCIRSKKYVRTVNPANQRAGADELESHIAASSE
jgi:hypothetical protein